MENIYTESEKYDRKYSPNMAAEAAQHILTEQTGKKQSLNTSPLKGQKSKVTLEKVNELTQEIIQCTKQNWIQ